MIPSAERPAVVVGAGMAGLAAAYELLRQGVEQFIVLEAAPQAGGVVQSASFEGFSLEAGPDSFLATKSAAADLCRAAGLAHSLTACAEARPRTWILHRGRLEPLPEGWQFLAPARMGPMLRTRLLSWRAKARLARAFLAPAAPSAGELSVAAWSRAQLGAEVLQTLVAPLLAGVYGGDPEALSLGAALPRFAALAAQSNVLRALWRQPAAQRGSDQPPQPLFLTLRGGLAQLPLALAAAIGPGRLRLRQAAGAITAAGGSYQVRLADGSAQMASAVIMAAPAWAAAEMLRPLAPALAQPLAAIGYSSAATVHLAYRQAPPMPPGFGFLVPRGEGRRLLAATFVHQKFPHRVPPGAALIRLFYGGALDPAAADLPEAALGKLAEEEVAAILRLRIAPDWIRIHRWPRSMPQYTLGHADRLAQIGAALRRHPGLALAGAAYQGVGLPDAMASGQAAARQILAP